VDAYATPIFASSIKTAHMAVGAAVGCQRVEKAGVHGEALGDSLLSSEGIAALEPANVGKSSLDGMRDSFVSQRPRREHSRPSIFPLR
jgi:hypothetical protein